MRHEWKPILKVVLLGDSGVGKTSLMHRFAKKLYIENYRATIGADFVVKDVVLDDMKISLHIWDTAGQERFNSLGNAYYRRSDCCVLVFDVTNPKTFVSIDRWKSDFLRTAAPRDPHNFPFILLGNKIELNMHTTPRIHPKLIKLWCESNNKIPYFETSARDNINVQEAFQTITRVAYAHGVTEENWELADFIDVNTDLPKIAQAESCCF